MTDTEIVLVVAAVGVMVGAAVFLVTARHFRKSRTAASTGALTPEQLRGVNDLAEQLERLIKDIDSKIADHLSRIDAAVAQADAKATQLRQAAIGNPRPAEPPLDPSQGEPLAQTQAEEAGQPIWEPPQGSLLEDQPVTLPGTWPVPPPRPQTAAPPAAPRDGSKLQSPRHAEVLRLQKQGLAVPDIARKLRMDIGEVELVLRLHEAGADPC